MRNVPGRERVFNRPSGQREKGSLDGPQGSVEPECGCGEGE